jgi:hypothetical protein
VEVVLAALVTAVGGVITTILLKVRKENTNDHASVMEILRSVGGKVERSEADGRDLLDALNDPTIRPTQIIKALQARQIKLSPSVITRYRAANVITQ